MRHYGIGIARFNNLLYTL